MSSARPELVWDGFTSQSQGMNDGLSQVRLGPNQASLLLNATTRGDFVKQRPGWPKVMRVLAEPPGFFQHGSWYRTPQGTIYLIVVVGGRFFRIDPLAKTVLEITIPNDPNPSTMPIGWSVQAERWWLYNDGQSRLFIYNGSSARRATAKELLPGSVLSYVQGRVWYASPDGLSFLAGDLVGNRDSGTAAYNYEDSILRQTENTYLNEGGSFRVPPDSGGIRAMRATAILDTSQGQGPLQVLCQNDGFSVNTPVDRTTWKDVTYPIQTVSLINAGASGSQNTINVNGDLFFRSPDGLRSFIIARRQFRDWGNTPQSFEVSGILDADQQNLLAYGSAVILDRRLLMTISPAWSSFGVYHRGLVAMDLSPINSITTQGTPVYDGIWTGLNILSILQTDIGVFAFTLAPDGSIELWQMSTNGLWDNESDPVTWTAIPRALFVEQDAAGRPLRTLKKLQTADLEYDKLVATTKFKLQWAPDSYPCYTDWHEWEECVVSCGTAPGCSPSLNLQEGYQPRRRVPEPPNLCATGADRPLRNFYRLNLRVDVTGPARLIGVRAGATLEGEPKYEANTCESPVCTPITCCKGTGEQLNPFTYTTPGQGPESANPYSGSGSGTPVPFPVPPVLPGFPSAPAPNPVGPGTPDTDPGRDTPDVPPSPTTPTTPVSPNPPSLGCLVFYGSWTDPRSGVSYELGRTTEPPDGLPSGVFEAWSNAMWQQFQQFVALQQLVVTQSQIITQFVGGDPNGGSKRWDAADVYTSGFYFGAYYRGWVLAIEYCIQT